jgi:glycosyltransferase involved in cell wall biosynthesis
VCARRCRNTWVRKSIERWHGQPRKPHLVKITLLDPGLASTQGHHFDLDLRLARALVQLGHSVDVHGFVNPDPGLLAAAKATGMALRSTFRVPTYVALPQARPALQAYEQMANATAADLAQVAASDLWVWPTMAPFQLAAALAQAPSVRQIGGLWWTPRFPHAVGARSWARSARQLMQAKGAITVGAYDPVLCRSYQSFSPGLDVVCLPCPHDGAANDRQPSELRRIGFFGHQRAARGLALVPELVTALVQRGFHVVVQDSGQSIQGKTRHPNVEVLQYVQDFAAEIARCDLVIWPSRWEAYVESFSGVMSECVATGVPIIAPSGCMPAEVLARFGCGSFFHEFSVEAIMEAVELAALEFPAVLARAHTAARLWHAENGTDRLAEWIDAQAGGAS